VMSHTRIRRRGRCATGVQVSVRVKQFKARLTIDFIAARSRERCQEVPQ